MERFIYLFIYYNFFSIFFPNTVFIILRCATLAVEHRIQCKNRIGGRRTRRRGRKNNICICCRRNRRIHIARRRRVRAQFTEQKVQLIVSHFACNVDCSSIGSGVQFHVVCIVVFCAVLVNCCCVECSICNAKVNEVDVTVLVVDTVEFVDTIAMSTASIHIFIFFICFVLCAIHCPGNLQKRS